MQSRHLAHQGLQSMHSTSTEAMRRAVGGQKRRGELQRMHPPPPSTSAIDDAAAVGGRGAGAVPARLGAMDALSVVWLYYSTSCNTPGCPTVRLIKFAYTYLFLYILMS